MDGRAGGRLVYGHVITKFSRMGSLPHFLTHGAPLRASRARAPILPFGIVAWAFFPTTFLEIAVYMYNVLPFVVTEMDLVKLWMNTKLISKYSREDIIKEKVEKRKFCVAS